MEAQRSAALNALAQSLTPALFQAAEAKEGEGLNAKIIVLANALAQEPSRFDEIQQYYVTDGAKNALRERSQGANAQLSSEVIYAPALRPEHLSAEYRKAWESYLLLVWVPGAPEGFADRVMEALAKIGDPLSVPAVEYRYKAAATNPRTDPKQFNHLLLELPSEASLHALLRCVEEWDKRADVRRAKSESQIPGLTPPENVGEGGSPADPSGEIKKLRSAAGEKLDSWRRIVAAGTSENAAQAAILEKIRAALRTE